MSPREEIFFAQPPEFPPTPDFGGGDGEVGSTHATVLPHQSCRRTSIMGMDTRA